MKLQSITALTLAIAIYMLLYILNVHILICSLVSIYSLRYFWKCLDSREIPYTYDTLLSFLQIKYN